MTKYLQGDFAFRHVWCGPAPFDRMKVVEKRYGTSRVSVRIPRGLGKQTAYYVDRAVDTMATYYRGDSDLALQACYA